MTRFSSMDLNITPQWLNPMAVMGVGVDVEEVERFRNMPYAANRAFYDKAFTDGETEYCLSRPDPYPHFAARFCAKEALIKAWGKLDTELGDIEVEGAGGPPAIRALLPAGCRAHVSMSHTADTAMALVVIESNDR
jgi:holo-[acyl-carrier protein] synthase